MDTKNVDENLLFALLALKMGLIDNERMVAALNAWAARKERSVGRELVAQEALGEARLFLVEQTVADLLDSSGGDAQQGTISLRLPRGLVETNLERINDPELRAALARLEAAEAGERKDAAVDPIKTDFDPQLAAGIARPRPARTEPASTMATGPAPDAGTGADRDATEPATGARPSPPATEPDPGRARRSGPGLVTTVDLGDSPDPKPGRAEKPAATATRAVPGPVRYRSLRPHAKGGLGEVFVALDEELGREVALKEIQTRHADRPDSRARFLIEAEVTGGLEHPGIVPVYGLGQYPDGRPYYAMRFIRGETLKDAIDAYHANQRRGQDPGAQVLALRALLNRLIAVCNALAYAHTRGVLHRDIKPANIMLGGFGETLLVDWGLAKTLDRPEAAREGELGPLRPLSAGASGTGTIYGSTVGTPNFMSPEQAAGAIDRLGPASDVYSMGATLYNVLTGRPPYHDPQVAVLLSKVRKGDFPCPGAVNRRVPPALEAICLKAMALLPEDRYPDTRALADDLEHWLADEPVSVYREPWPARLARWARRHRTLVTTAGALLLTALAALAISTVLIRREQARTEANFQLARTAVDEMLTRLGEVELADVPQMEPVRRRMLGKALHFYQTFLAERGHDRSIRRETGRANLRLGDIDEMLGEFPAAEAAYSRAITLLTDLEARQPGADDVRRDLATTRHQLGVLLKRSNRFTEADRSLNGAQRLRQELVAADPDNPDLQHEATETVYQRGTVLARLGRVKEVEAAYAAAVDSERRLAAAHPDQPGYPRELGRYLNNRGILERSTQAEPKAAEASFRAALDLQKPLAERSPTVAGLQWERARTTSNLAATLEQTQGIAQALPVYQEARDALRRLADDFPSVPDYQSELAVVSFNLGAALLNAARDAEPSDAELAARLRGEAAGPLDAAAATYRKLIRPERFPHRPDYRQRLAQAERKRGMLLASSGRPDEADTAFRAAVRELQALEAQYPQVPEYQSDLGVALQNVALHRLKGDQLTEARRSIDDSIAHQRAALASNPKDPFARRYLLEAYEVLETALKRLGNHAAAADAAEALVTILPDEPLATFHSARMLATSASLVAAAADIPAAERKSVVIGRTELALKRLQKALKEGARIVPGELDAPGFDAIRAHAPETIETLKRNLEADAHPRVG
jgi:serine/threonine-protein kinase